MKLQQRVPLSELYEREEEFSADLAENLGALKVGEFEDAETEGRVGTRRADIVAAGDEDETLVVECQFGKANWDHWGRLEAYARLKEASVAVLVAEEFEDLMIVTCRLRDEDSRFNWYLIEAHASAHGELSFHRAAGPAIDIQTERKANFEESEFWAPIRRGEFGSLYIGKPVPRRHEAWVSKRIRRIGVTLNITQRRCYVQLRFKASDASEREQRRKQVMALFPESDYTFELVDTPKNTVANFPVLDKGLLDVEDYDEIREALTSRGTELYNRISESGL